VKISRAAFASVPFLLLAIERSFARTATASSYLLATNSGTVQRLEILGNPSSPSHAVSRVELVFVAHGDRHGGTQQEPETDRKEIS
jgi:hypothetical protein